MNVNWIPKHLGLCFACAPRGLVVLQPKHTVWHVEQAALTGVLPLEKVLAFSRPEEIDGNRD